MAYEMPGTEGLLEVPVNVDGTNIEIVRPYDGRRLTKALFDFDGTLSRERDGWPNLMVACNSGALCQALDISPREAVEWAIADIEATIGIPTYSQMKRMAQHIAESGGAPKSPATYKAIYNDALVSMVAEKHARARAGELPPDDLQVRGAGDLLERLAKRIGKDSLYVGSGTDIKPVLESISVLGLDEFFDEGNIVAAGSTEDPEQCAKELVVARLVSEQNLQPGELLCFGDGFPELLHAYRAGGVGVGVLTPDQSNYESRGHFTIEKKRRRLLEAGAHVLVPDFSFAEELVEVMFSRQP